MSCPPNESQRPQALSLSGVLRPKRNAPARVLICEPQLVTYVLPYLPVMWGILKTYWEQHAARPDLIDWYEPIHEMRPPEELTKPYENKPIDIVGLSCYTWNWRLQLRIAEQIRATHPDCIIVAGGPHPDYRDPQFFDKHPAIDAVVVKDGEVPFTQILERVLAFESTQAFREAGMPMSDIPGLCLPGTNGKLTSPSVVPDSYSVSAYLAQREYYEKFYREHPSGVCVAWETSRGCPFRCSYCDWGSSTMSKVRRFDMERLQAEIEWFTQNKTIALFSVDSNFGMFKTDVDITDRIVESKSTSGYPHYFVYSNAKNVPDRTVEITRKVVQAGLDTAHTLSIQHTCEDVLEATDRKNISVDKQINVVRELQNDGIPINVQLILGLPRDTPARWRRSFTDLMEWGVHDGYVITNYHLLPNAPAASPEYREQWQLRTIERYIYDGNGIQENAPVDPLTYARGDIIIETSSFDRDDWVTMSTEAAIIRGLHNPGITQGIAKFMRHSLGVPYESLYALILDDLFENTPQLRQLREQIQDCYRSFIQDNEAHALLPMPGRSDEQFLVETHRWLFAQIVSISDEFFTALEELLIGQYGHHDLIRSICAYQNAVLVRPDYDKRLGTIVTSKHDWISYFQSLQTDDIDIPAPDEVNCDLIISDTGWDDRNGRSDYNWPVGRSPEAWTAWFHCIVYGRLSPMKCNHQNLELRPREIGSERSEVRIRA